MAEPWKLKLLRWRFNWFPAFRRTGGRVIHLGEDLLSVTVRLPLNRATRNIHGTIYGGAMYAVVDPLHAVLIARHLGPKYMVWMKSASISYLRPGASDLFATARVPAGEIESIRSALEQAPKTDRTYGLELVNQAGVTSAQVSLTLHIRRRDAASPVPDGDYPL